MNTNAEYRIQNKHIQTSCKITRTDSNNSVWIDDKFVLVRENDTVAKLTSGV